MREHKDAPTNRSMPSPQPSLSSYPLSIEWSAFEQDLVLTWLESHPNFLRLGPTETARRIKHDVFPDTPALTIAYIRHKIDRMICRYWATLDEAGEPGFGGKTPARKRVARDLCQQRCRWFTRLGGLLKELDDGPPVRLPAWISMTGWERPKPPKPGGEGDSEMEWEDSGEDSDDSDDKYDENGKRVYRVPDEVWDKMGGRPPPPPTYEEEMKFRAEWEGKRKREAKDAGSVERANDRMKKPKQSTAGTEAAKDKKKPSVNTEKAELEQLKANMAQIQAAMQAQTKLVNSVLSLQKSLESKLKEMSKAVDAKVGKN